MNIKKYVRIFLVGLSMHAFACNSNAASSSDLPLPSFDTLQQEAKLLPYPFHTAAGLGNAPCVFAYLTILGICPDYRTSRGFTALHCAALKGKVEVVRILIASGANINAQAENNVTPLHFAAEQGHYQVVEVLLNAGARTDLKMTRPNMTARGWAMMYKKKEIAALIGLHQKRLKTEFVWH
jgi:ankyrin repeat protein